VTARQTKTGLLVLGLVLSACSDPVKSQLIDSLGGEQGGVPEGPLHRPGQPCLACHDGTGPADSVFRLAGTIYQDAMTTKPLQDALVHFEDANGKKFDSGANCAGNFYVRDTDWAPAWPVWVKIVYGTAMGMPVPHNMGSPIYRDGSCATCHTDPASVQSAGHVYLSPDPLPIPPSPECR